PAKTIAQEVLQHSEIREPVLRPHQFAAFIRKNQVSKDAAQADGLRHLIAFAACQARITSAVGKQQRAFDASGVKRRRAYAQQLTPSFRARVSDALIELIAPPRRGTIKHRKEICRRGEACAAAILIRREGESREHGVAAKARTDDRDAILLSNTLRNRPLGCVRKIFLNARPPLAIAGIEKRFAETSRAAEVHREHRIAAIG